MKKKLSALALLGASALVLAGCSTPAAEQPTAENTDAEETAAEETETTTDDGGTVTVWVLGSDTPDSAREYLKTTFEAENPGWTLDVVEKTWSDVNETYVADLSSNNAPDVVEFGNTQVAGFADQGLLLDITDLAADLGGDDLLPGLVEAGTYEGSLYAAPYYAGGRIVFYTPQIVDGDLPKTLDEYVAMGEDLTDNVRSGIYAPGKDWYNALPYVWAHGGEVAVQGDDGTWDAQFSSPESVAGLTQLQQVYLNATNAPKDSDETNAATAFCEGNIGFLSAPGWLLGQLTAIPAEEDEPGCGDSWAEDLNAFPLPGLEEGTTAPVFAGGSNMGIPFKSANPEKAKEALKIMTSSGYQELLAEIGLTPGIASAASALPDTPFAKAQGEALANSRVTPSSPNWAEVESAQVIQDALVRIADGGDVAQIAAELDSRVEEILNK